MARGKRAAATESEGSEGLIYSDDVETIDPIITGLLKRLPVPGQTWPKAQRELWLKLLEGSFDLIYADTADAPVEPIQ